jgi:HK97 family phage major capsid protein
VLQTGENNAVEYVRESGRTAAAVAEATALTGTSGIKPEGGLTFAKVTVPVRTIAEWLPLTTRILQDAPNLRAYVDKFLSGDLALEVEDLMLTGDGIGENFTGILNTAGVQTTAVGAAPAQVLDAIRTAKKLVFVNGRATPNAVVMYPDDLAEMDGLKDSTEQYIGPGPFTGGVRFAWGLPLIETDSIPAGTALVGAFDRAILFDRQSVSISVGTINDQFVRNQVAVLAELRAAFAVVRPAAFCTVTGA